MSEPSPSDLPGADLDRFRQWKPDAQARALALIREQENRPWTPFYCKNRNCNGQPHRWPRDARPCPHPYGHEWDDTIDLLGCKHCGVESDAIDDWQFRHARIDQRPPRWRDDWLTLLLRGGRGSGKTRTGAEITNRATEVTHRIILIAATGPDLRNTMVEGESGILSTAAPGKRPTWEPSKKRLTWPNGCIAEGFSAEEPDRLRGPQSGYVWADEPSHYPLITDVWDNMLFGLRLPGKNGHQPKIVATSTPKPNEWTKEMVAAEDTVDRVVSTYANLSNLAETYKRTVIKRYEGSRTGLQELEGKLLEDVEGALWTYGIINHVKEENVPAMRRKTVSVDPAGTANKRSDETGITVQGVGVDDKFYVIADYTGKFSPSGWANEAINAAIRHDCDAIVYEKNYGGDMVREVLSNELKRRGLQHRFRLIAVTSRKGKELRAEPIVGMYEQDDVFHVGERGDLAKLEEEQTTWVPHPKKGQAKPSPNRVDAVVHGLTDLAKGVGHVAVSNPITVLRGRRGPSNRWLGGR